MKKIILITVGLGIAAGLGFYLSRPGPAPISPEPATETATTASPAAEDPQPSSLAAPGIQPPAAEVRKVVASNVQTSSPVVAASNVALDGALLKHEVDVLVSPQSTYQQKQQTWKELRDNGKLDQVIAQLEQRTAEDPRTADLPAALGQAYLHKCGTIKDIREQGILAMQADKMFDTALKLDPLNWEARFTKAMAMSYWPPMLNKGEEVVSLFHTLVQQQEAQTPQPQFAETYTWLGDQYLKAGRTNDARATWERGAGFFPGDDKLRTRLAAQ